MIYAFSNPAFYLAPLMGIVAFLIGSAALVKPGLMATKFGIAADAKAIPYVVSTGIRDVFMGLVILVLFFSEQMQTLSLITILVALVALSDFLMVRSYGDRKMSWLHLGSALVAGLYGIFLLIAGS